MTRRHSLYHRILWHPVFAAAVLGYAIYRCWFWGFSGIRVAAIVFGALWVGMAVADTVSGHKVLNWLYDRDGKDGPS